MVLTKHACFSLFILIFLVACSLSKTTQINQEADVVQEDIVFGDDEFIINGSHGDGESEFIELGKDRKVIYRDRSMIRNATSKAGMILIKVCINPEGTVTFVEIDQSETTINDINIRKDALKAMVKYRYEPDPDAPQEQCGTYKLKIDTVHGLKH